MKNLHLLIVLFFFLSAALAAGAQETQTEKQQKKQQKKEEKQAKLEKDYQATKSLLESRVVRSVQVAAETSQSAKPLPRCSQRLEKQCV